MPQPYPERAHQTIDSTKAIKRVAYLLRSDRTLICLAELLNHSGLTSEILLATDQDDGQTSAEMSYFGDPLYMRWRQINKDDARTETFEVL